jgi:uncharacterized membrane protein YeaQ/YmgE (transglycosylase-associated protein family)
LEARLAGPNESEVQPQLFGYAVNPKLGRFGPSQTLAVLYDFYYYPELAETADRLPYRSPEYYPATKQIRGVALGVQDPYLNLGMVAMNSQEKHAELGTLVIHIKGGAGSLVGIFCGPPIAESLAISNIHSQVGCCFFVGAIGAILLTCSLDLAKSIANSPKVRKWVSRRLGIE